MNLYDESDIRTVIDGLLAGAEYISDPEKWCKDVARIGNRKCARVAMVDAINNSNGSSLPDDGDDPLHDDGNDPLIAFDAIRHLNDGDSLVTINDYYGRLAAIEAMHEAAA